jgi:RHS repeat-associated protein
MRVARLVLVVAIILGSAAWLHAQMPPNLENGFKNWGSYDSTKLDTVNTLNGNQMLHAPLLPNYPQRGGSLTMQSFLYQTSKSWQVFCSVQLNNEVTCQWGLGRAGVNLRQSEALTIQRTMHQFGSGTGQVSFKAYGYTVQDATGTTHQMLGTGPLDSTGESTKFDSIDTSGYHLEMSTPDSYGVMNTATVTDRHGTQYLATSWIGGTDTGPTLCPQLPGNHLLPAREGGGVINPIIDDAPMGQQDCAQAAFAEQVTDSNGNRISNASAGPTDTMGRTFAFFNGGTTTTDYSDCASSHPVNFATFQSYTTPDGTTRQMKLCYGNIPIATAFNVPGIVELTGAASSQLVTLVLADGTKWTFDYDNYGEVKSVGLPTGGSISYTWTTIAFPSCAMPDGGVSRAVATRTLNDNGHSYIWHYNWGTVVDSVISNTVTDPLNNDTVHVFTSLDGIGAGNCGFFETRTQSYQGTGGSRQLLKQVDTSYSKSFFGIETVWGSGLGGVVPSSIQTKIYPSGKVSLVEKTYAPPTVTGGPISGAVATEKDYDWGQPGQPGQPGPLLRETDTTYEWQVNGAYASANMLDLPSSVIVKDGGGHPVAETDYTYDEAPYLTAANVSTQHFAAPNSVRGNLTTVSHWLNTTNSFVASHTNWYDTGEVYKAIDPLGHITTHSYDSFYKGAYSTQTCSPTTNGVGHCVSGTYDFNTGVLTSLTNENATTQASGNTQGDAAHTSNFVTDFEWRITSAQAPPDPANNSLRATTSFNFSPPNTFPLSVQRSKSVTTALSDSATSFFDGLGRGYKGQHVLPNGTATVDTTFDLAGHPATVSNPYFSTSDPTYGLTTNVYDALDRVTQTTKQDGSISSVAYNVVTAIAVPGDCTQTTDEAGKQRRACVDGLGRLVEVDETGDSFAGSQAGASLAVSGTLQSGSRATGSVTIQGSEQSKPVAGDPGGGCDPGMICDGGGGSGGGTIYDTGTVTITVNGHAYAYGYGGSDTTTDTTGTVASGLAAAINADSSAVVTASASGAIVTLTAKAPGPGGNVSLASSHTWDTADFFSASFTTVNSGAALTGGSNSSGVYDAGTMTVVIGTFSASVTYGSTGNSTSAQVASALATALSASSSPVTASASGSTVSLTYKTIGTAGNVTVNCSSATSQGASFFGPSFTCPASFALSNGFNPQSPSLDHAFYATLYFYDALGNLLCVEQHGNSPAGPHGDGTAGTGCSVDPSNDASSTWRVRRFTYDSLSRLLTAKNPESGTISYTYDADGELLQKTSPAANPNPPQPTQTVSYCYDELHRATGKGYGAQSCPLATPVVTYAYDSGANAKGKLTSLLDQAGTATYAYDILGRLATETRTLIGANNASIPKTVSYEYNLDGSLYKLHYPSGAVVTYTPDSAGRTLSAVDSGSAINYVTGATYGPDSALTSFVSGNSGTFAGITNSFAYNKRLQPLTMSATAPSQTVFSIGYDFHAGNGTAGSGTNNGNVYGIFNYKDTTHGRDQTFTYDALNRLISAQNAGTNCATMALGNKTEYWGNSYGYDAWGNLLQKTITKCGAEHLSVTADAHNWIHASGTDYQYDAAGNMTYDATASLSYNFDQENRLTGAAGYTYTYDGDGNRVRKSNGSTGTLYWYMTPGIVGESDLSGNLTDEYVFFDGERVARKSTNGVFYYFSDHLKTASVVTDFVGSIKSESDFYPWGGELQFVANDSNHFKLTGKERDSETGLDYFGARYYSNALSRFLTPDWAAKASAVPYADFADPQSLNLYTYVRSIPTSRADADGHTPDILVIENGPTEGNPIGHTAIAVTGQGIFSFGNSTPLGSSTTDYLSQQSSRRDTTVYVIKTTPEQDKAAVNAALQQDQKGTVNTYPDNCSDRTNKILDAAGVPPAQVQGPASPYIPPSHPDSAVPGTAGVRAEEAQHKDPSKVETILIPKGSAVPDSLKQFNPGPNQNPQLPKQENKNPVDKKQGSSS